MKYSYIVYKTTNLINDKFYIGVHKISSQNKNDSYLGSGKLLNLALSKYGRENFCREILFEFDNHIEAYDKERELVNDSLIQSINCYNMVTGGLGGDKISSKSKEEKEIIYSKISVKNTGRNDTEEVRLKKKISAAERIKKYPNSIPNNKGRKHKGDGLENIRKSVQKTHTGSKYISNGIQSLKIKKNTYWVMEKDWYYGRPQKNKDLARNRKHTEESINAISKYNIGLKCYNNGIINVKIRKGDKIPKGFVLGMIRRNKSTKI